MVSLLPAGLRARLLLLVAVAIVPPMGMLIQGGLEDRRTETEAIRRDALNLAKLAAQAQERRLEGARQFLIAMSRSSDIRSGDLAACRAYVTALALNHRETYTNIGLADVTGRVQCHALPDSGSMSITDRTYFQRAMASGTFAVGDHMLGRISGRAALGFSYPLRSDRGDMVGVLFANVDLRDMSRSLQMEPLSQEATLTVLDRNGTILARSVAPEDWIGNRATPDQVRTMTARGEIVTESRGPDGVDRVYAVTAVRDPSKTPVLFTAVGIRRDLALAAVDRRLATRLAALALLGFGVIGLAWAGAEVLIRRPVMRLVDATAVLAAGNLKARADAAHGVRELVDLGRAFNQMAERLEQRDIHLRHSQRLEAVGQLAGGIAHDFNNLLTVIIGYGESIASRPSLTREDAEEIAQLLASARRAADLTQQLLAFSRRQTLQPQALQLNDTVTRIHSMLARLIGENIRLATVLAGDLGVVRADPAQLEQVILNLVINARDAMPSGGTLTLETRNVDVDAGDPALPAEQQSMPAGPYVLLRVTDAGSGMDEATRSRIFEPFFSTKGARGTGLGLATVYGIVKQSDGFIWCETEVGRGTRFSIYLPRTADMIEARHAPSAMPALNGHERILVVEDEASVRSLLEVVLRRNGYRVRATGSGEEAIEWLRNGTEIELLITDVMMPGMTGPELAVAARKMRPRLKVLFVSGYASEVSADFGLPANAEFLQKPFAQAELLAKVRNVIEQPSPAVAVGVAKRA